MRLPGRRRREEREAEEDLAAVRVLADEDVTQLGEELTRLDGEVARLDRDGRVDYQKALDAYEAARRSVPRMRRADDVAAVVDTLSTARYAMACVRARLDGRPLPELKPPCYFDPQHGPSTYDVRWTAPGRGTRMVPACAQDAARVADGERPNVRTVRVGGRRIAYWEAGTATDPYRHGYHVSGHVGRAARPAR